jgi:hypothetical protein
MPSVRLHLQHIALCLPEPETAITHSCMVVKRWASMGHELVSFRGLHCRRDDKPRRWCIRSGPSRLRVSDGALAWPRPAYRGIGRPSPGGCGLLLALRPACARKRRPMRRWALRVFHIWPCCPRLLPLPSGPDCPLNSWPWPRAGPMMHGPAVHIPDRSLRRDRSSSLSPQEWCRTPPYPRARGPRGLGPPVTGLAGPLRSNSPGPGRECLDYGNRAGMAGTAPVENGHTPCENRHHSDLAMRSREGQS